MSRKRFMDCDRWRDPWYSSLPVDLGGLNIRYIFDYLSATCDIAGVWTVNPKYAAFDLGYEERLLDISVIFESMNKPVSELVACEEYPRLVKLEGGRKWWLSRFVKFHYGKGATVCLSDQVPIQLGVIKAIRMHNGLEELMRECKLYGKHFIVGKNPAFKPQLPTRDFVVQLASDNGLPVDDAVNFWKFHQGNGWNHDGTAVRDKETVLDLLKGWCKKAGKSKQAANGEPNPKQIREQIARIEGEIERHSKDVFVPEGQTFEVIRPEAAREIKLLKARVEELKGKL